MIILYIFLTFLFLWQTVPWILVTIYMFMYEDGNDRGEAITMWIVFGWCLPGIPFESLRTECIPDVISRRKEKKVNLKK
jgi:hypothetical protein